MRTARVVPRLAVALLLAAGCGHNISTPVPVDVGFAPLEPLSPLATYPPANGNVLHPQALGPLITVPGAGHYGTHAVGFVAAPLAKVYLAMHDPASGYIHNTNPPTFDGPPTLDVEPQFPISFVVHYLNHTPIGDVGYDVTTRGGVSSGNELAPLEVGRRYDKTWGTAYIGVMSGSLVARPVPGDPSVTEVELQSWLKAQTQGQVDCDSTLVDQYNDLLGVVAALP